MISKQSNVTKYFKPKKNSVGKGSHVESTPPSNICDEYFLKTEWQKYIDKQCSIQMKQIRRALDAQEAALSELKKDNLNFYLKAIQVRR